MLGEEVLFQTVHELGERIRDRKLSPVELCEAYLERGRTVGSKLGAYATLMPDSALAEARVAEKEIAAGKWRGPLHGMPYAAKDLLAARGAPTTWGARPFAAQKLDYDATVIHKLREAGAVLLGKSAMIELAGGFGYRFADASLTGAAKNPWNAACWTCGSSSGSAAIVSAGLAAFAIGSETWGSIICPSAFCGITGFRPTFGRVSRHGTMALAFSMDKLGPMARSAADCALVMAAIAGHDPADPVSLSDDEAAWKAATAPKPLRIGRLTNAWTRLGPSVGRLFDAAIATLRRLGARVEPVELPEGPWEAAAGITLQVEAVEAFANLIESGRVAELHDPMAQTSPYVAEATPTPDFIRAQRVRGVLARKMEALFQKVDLLAAPSLPITANRVEANLEDELGFSDPLGAIGNFVGLPAVSVPCGFGPDKLPLGLKLVGPPLSDATVLAVAELYQQKSDWHRKRPPAA